MKKGEFDYREGAVMHQIILADEINRTSPKTQSSLLEAMEEGQTTVGGKKYKLPDLSGYKGIRLVGISPSADLTEGTNL